MAPTSPDHERTTKAINSQYSINTTTTTLVTTTTTLERQVKDVAAGCVLVATILAVVIESFVFIPRLLRG